MRIDRDQLYKLIATRWRIFAISRGEDPEFPPRPGGRTDHMAQQAVLVAESAIKRHEEVLQEDLADWLLHRAGNAPKHQRKIIRELADLVRSGDWEND